MEAEDPGAKAVSEVAVVVEPTVTAEKLTALLAEQCEQFCLDYKSTLNLGKGHVEDLVELAKDVAAMQSNPDGGYIVVGADDRGNIMPGPSGGLTAELAKHLDEATLRPKLEKYLSAPVIHSACHEIGQHLVGLIYVAPDPYGWSVIHTTGVYLDSKGRSKTVFRSGDVLVRHGTSSERWNDNDRDRLVRQIVARSKEAWRKEITEEFAAHLATMSTVGQLANAPTSAIDWKLDADTYEQVLTELLRREDDIPLRHLLIRTLQDAAVLLASDQDELRRLLDRLTTFAALSIEYEREAWLGRVVEVLVRIYELGFDEYGHGRDSDPIVVRLWLDVTTRVYALGALAVRRQAWFTVRYLAVQEPPGEARRHWGTWLRHATVMAFRARVFETEEKAGLLARAHNVIREMGALRPDVTSESPAVLNSLCQFDVYAALAVIGVRGKVSHGNFYTHFARYYSPRSTPAFETIVTDAKVRAALFDGDDQLLADAIREVVRMASKESFYFDGWDGLQSPAVERFVQVHASSR
ncbi:helix-turn-helix domain-containing protein [Lentzea sp. NEAU-D7]|uniref:AlbA family DNA-binding domain-containing protein n=1 Tax=Lentzea sp. NEAU-D7 TaxID=2994667 RepID=UPI00224AF048|nr:hypothetical protein [Lentzea sp. NEAU-D7]MCX2954469.1 hypothetical protein [Lentzea sp. NEAU-D7]